MQIKKNNSSYNTWKRSSQKGSTLDHPHRENILAYCKYNTLGYQNDERVKKSSSEYF